VTENGGGDLFFGENKAFLWLTGNEICAWRRIDFPFRCAEPIIRVLGKRELPCARLLWPIAVRCISVQGVTLIGRTHKILKIKPTPSFRRSFDSFCLLAWKYNI